MNEKIYDDRYKQGYRNKLDSYEKARFHALDDVLKKIKINKNEKLKILDYGCGNGLFIPLIKKNFKNSQHFFSDISKTALNKLIMNYPEYINNTFLIRNNKINSKKENGGYFIWTTPCGNSYSIEHLFSLITFNIERTNEGYIKWKWEDPTHLRRLKSHEIKNLLLNKKFKKVIFFYRAHFFSFVFSKFCFYPFKKIVEKIMFLDYIFFKKFKNGASMIGVAKK